MYDGPHPIASCVKWMGAYQGLVYKRVVIDDHQWKPTMPLLARISGNSIIVKFNVPYGPLVFDTKQVKDPGNYGFDVVANNGDSILVSDVSITKWNEVTINLQTTPQVGCSVRYGYIPGTSPSGRLAGPRGNLRDSQGDVLKVKELNLPMHNWCIFFSLQTL